jgi:hypothetical protein
LRYPCSKPAIPCLRSPVLLDRLPLATEASTTVSHLAMRPARFFSGARIDLHLSTLTIHRHFRAHARARVRGVRLRDPRSRTCSVTSFDDFHLSVSATFECRDPPAPAPRDVHRLLSNGRPAMSSIASKIRETFQLLRPRAMQPEHTHCARSYSAYCH